ncbi:hypothetical protein [Christiangramia echinicola]|uniref:Uncharacterized protein n=1 Tax=Christiangramia echinicola TaxID=279359 RepID=A0A1H1KUA0_9FLAO|nr:hypothetical protein [Christiangramia echinicola]SDR65918.1 hypothetical protein SAMN04488552_0212 [Christiangramia echinicola]
MEFIIDIKLNLKFTLENGFEISETKDFGMAQFCLLKYPILDLEIWKDRFDYNAIIAYNEEKYNVIHIANFLNDKEIKYSFFDFGFETREIDAKRFLTQLDQIIRVEFDKILEFLFIISPQKQNDFDRYCEETNAKLKGW